MMKLQGLAREHCTCQVICQGRAGAPACVNLFDVYSGGCWTVAACSGEPRYPDLCLKVLRSFFPNTDKKCL